MIEAHRKTHPSIRAARRERTMLRVVAGDGVVPLHDLRIDGRDQQVVTVLGRGSLADVLAQLGPIPEAAARGTGARIARTLARLHADGVVHGDIKPANVVFAPDGDLWLIDFDAAGADGSSRCRGTRERLPRTHTRALLTDDDVLALAIMVVECATAVVLDPSASWSDHDLERIGCSVDLAADIAFILRALPAASRVGALLHRRDNRLPRPPGGLPSADPTPTVDIVSVDIVGLDPIGEPTKPGAPTGPPGRRHSDEAGRG